MYHQKVCRISVLLLTALLLLSGCKEDTSFILPPNTTSEAVLSTVPADTVPTEAVTLPTEAATVPTDAPTAPTQATEPQPTQPAETQPPVTQPKDPQPAATQPVETQPPATQPAETQPPATQPQPTEHQHRYDKTVAAPGCTTEGYTLYTCACGDSYRGNQKSALGHDYTITVVEPTTEHWGYDLHTCSRCGDSFKDHYVEALTATSPREMEPPETEPSHTESTEPQETQPADTHPVYDISDHTVGSLEYEILAEINARRTEEGLGELQMDTRLCALAAIRAYESSISFSHTRPDGRSCFSVLTDYNYGGCLSGENLLYCSPAYSASELVDVWMHSTGHKNNIISSSFTKAGLGIYYTNGRTYVANFFAG